MSAAGPLKRELLMEEITLKEGWIRKLAMWELRSLIGDEATGILQAALKTDPDVAVREQAAGLLGQPGGEGNIVLLQKAFREDEFKVTVAAARSLNQLGQPGPMLELIPQLSAKLDSLDGGVRRDAVDMLGGFLTPTAIPYITRALSDSNSDVRRSAVLALGNFGETGHLEVIPLLESAAQDSNGDVAEMARDFLKRLKNDK
jgi:HEAT repeat protein